MGLVGRSLKVADASQKQKRFPGIRIPYPEHINFLKIPFHPKTFLIHFLEGYKLREGRILFSGGLPKADMNKADKANNREDALLHSPQVHPCLVYFRR